MCKLSKIFFLQHFYEEGEYDIVTDIGVYSTKERAQEMLKKLKKYPKFASHPDEFIIEEYEIDKSEWQEGFFTY